MYKPRYKIIKTATLNIHTALLYKFENQNFKISGISKTRCWGQFDPEKPVTCEIQVAAF